MKKLLVAVLVVAVSMMFAVAAQATEEVKIKGKTTVTEEGSTTKMKVDSPDSKTKIEAKESASGEVRQATVTKEAKGTQPVLKRKVQFHSYDQGTDTITVIQEKKLVRYPTKNLDSKRPYVLKWEKEKPITITSTYDPKLGKHVVMDAAITPLQK